MEEEKMAEAMAPEKIQPPALPPHLAVAEVLESAAEATAVAAGGEIAEDEEIQERSSPQEDSEPETELSGPSLLKESVRKMQEQQEEQARLIASMQTTIDSLSETQSALEKEIRGLKGESWIIKADQNASVRCPRQQVGAKAGVTANRPQVRSAPSASSPYPLAPSTSSPHSSAQGVMEGVSTDEDIAEIIESRRAKKSWPLKRKYCKSFTQEVDLLRIRFHRSEAYPHRSVRIPKVDKSEEHRLGLGNREGRLICRLCSGKAINRNTSWMCGTCLVPLCVDVTDGDPESSCHARWHTCRDLVEVNFTLNTALRIKRESKKRSRDSMEAVEENQRTQQALTAQHELQAEVLVPVATEEVAPAVPVKVELQEIERQHQQEIDDPQMDISVGVKIL